MKADHTNSHIEDFTQEWSFQDNSVDFIHARWLVGAISDWTEFFLQAYRVLKPGGWIETFECNGFFECDDDTMTDETALRKWGYFFREGPRALGSKVSFSVVKDGLQRKGLEEANFTRITENPLKVYHQHCFLFTSSYVAGTRGSHCSRSRHPSGPGILSSS